MPRVKRQKWGPGRVVRAPALELPGFGPRGLRLYLPAALEAGRGPFPLALFFDGQNLFGDEGSFAGGWHLHEALDRRAALGKVVPVVAAFDHGGMRRLHELGPWGRGAEGEAFLAALSGPALHWLEQHLPLERRPEARLLGGSSMGGLMALYGLLRRPEVWGGALSMSPSLWWGHGAIFPYASHHPPRPGQRVYLDCGRKEARGHAYHQAERMAWFLAERGLQPGTDLMWRPDAKGLHKESHWRRRLPKALRFFYG